MAAVTDTTQINGWFKESYADKIEDLIPDNRYYVKEAKELASEKQPGGNYTVPVTLSSEQGITKAASNAGAFALNSPIALASDQAQLLGSQFLMRTALPYDAIFRTKNKNSFVKATKGAVENMIKSAYFYLEADTMWGRTGLGVVSGIAGNDITLTTATWASGLWLGSENRRLRIETSAGVLRGECSVSTYDIEGRTVTVDAAPAGVAATDVIYFAADGASGANCMVGLYSAMGTTTGDLWGISRTTYGLWRPCTAYGVGAAPLSFNHIMNALTLGANKGLGDDIGEIDVVVNPGAFTDLGNDLAALRALDSSYKTTEVMNGAESITFHSQVGKVNIIPHKMMKEGYAFIHPKASRCWQYVGAQPKPTFELPGMVANGEKQYLRTMENNAGVETRLYYDAAIFTTHIGKTLVMSGIVNSSTS